MGIIVVYSATLQDTNKYSKTGVFDASHVAKRGTVRKGDLPQANITLFVAMLFDNVQL